MKYQSTIKTNEIISFSGKCIEIESILLSETSQTLKVFMFLLYGKPNDYKKQLKEMMK